MIEDVIKEWNSIIDNMEKHAKHDPLFLMRKYSLENI
jgi:hypothetical protein